MQAGSDKFPMDISVNQTLPWRRIILRRSALLCSVVSPDFKFWSFLPRSICATQMNNDSSTRLQKAALSTQRQEWTSPLGLFPALNTLIKDDSKQFPAVRYFPLSLTGLKSAVCVVRDQCRVTLEGRFIPHPRNVRKFAALSTWQEHRTEHIKKRQTSQGSWVLNGSAPLVRKLTKPYLRRLKKKLPQKI